MLYYKKWLDRDTTFVKRKDRKRKTNEDNEKLKIDYFKNKNTLKDGASLRKVRRQLERDNIIKL